jgi:hypothetical protein
VAEYLHGHVLGHAAADVVALGCAAEVVQGCPDGKLITRRRRYGNGTCKMQRDADAAG